MAAPKRRLLAAAQWSALRHPRRMEVMVTMEAHSRCSIAELASAMGCGAAGLYRHVQALVRAGLLRAAGRKSVGRRWTTIYTLGPAHAYRHYHAPSGRGLREHGDLAAALARPAGRAYLRGVLAQRGKPQSAARRKCLAMFERTWLDAASQAEARRLIQALYALVQRGRRARRGERFQISVMSAPLAR